MDTNKLKAFTLLVGREWHDLPRENKMQGALIVGHKNNPPNPTWDNPHLIRKAIEAVPCGECEGSGIIHVSAGDGKHSTDFFQSYDEEPCPTCNGKGVINEWAEFVRWHNYLMIDRTLYVEHDKINNGGVCSMDERWIKYEASADILTTPELLIQAYLSWKESNA